MTEISPSIEERVARLEALARRTATFGNELWMHAEGCAMRLGPLKGCDCWLTLDVTPISECPDCGTDLTYYREKA